MTCLTSPPGGPIEIGAVTAGENTLITTVHVTDQDINDPIDVLLIKADAENGSALGAETLEGAEFTVKSDYLQNALLLLY